MRSLCRVCNRTFGSVTVFDQHRTGHYTDTPPDYGRRCLTDTELAVKNITPNAKGVYTSAYAGPVAKEEAA